MKSILFSLCFLPWSALAQQVSDISTVDIDHFWMAYDQLAGAHSREDSLQIIEQGYLDTATPYFKEFIKARGFTAEEYIGLIGRYPAFWSSIRPLTERIVTRKDEIEQVLNRLQDTLPHFKRPDVCFAIGGLRTGGTTSKHLILIGAEMAAADGSIDKSDLNPWLQAVLGSTGDIVSMVAHEAVHTQQTGFPVFEFFRLLKYRRLSLLNMAIVEGSADFITAELLGLNINQTIHAYGEAHQRSLWKEFKADCVSNPYVYSRWLYNGNDSKDRPADLAYYLGACITSSYYDLQVNKRKALKTMLKRGQYKRILKQSDFENLYCSE